MNDDNHFCLPPKFESKQKVKHMSTIDTSEKSPPKHQLSTFLSLYDDFINLYAIHDLQSRGFNNHSGRQIHF